MGIESIVNVTITTLSKGVSRKGFGVILCAAHHTQFGERSREYTSIGALEADGFLASSKSRVHRMATAAFSASPKPEKIVVGRNALPMAFAGRLTPVDTSEGLLVKATVISPDGTSTLVSHTNGAAETVAAIVTDLQGQLDAITDLSATDSTTRVDVDADVAGEMFDFDDMVGLEWLDETPDPGIVTDLAAIIGAGADFYGVAVDGTSEAILNAARTFVESRELLGGFTTHDDQVLDAAVTDDVMSDFQDATVARSSLIYSADQGGYAGIAWMGDRFPFDPGSSTFKFKSLAGVAVDALTDTQISGALSKNGNIYITVGGRNITCDGKVGAGEFIDIVRGRDWLVSRIRERVFSALANNPKIPFTDAGVAIITSLIRAQLNDGIGVGLLAADPAPVVTAPLVADVSATDKINRLLPDIEFTATLAGAIHAVQINGVLSV